MCRIRIPGRVDHHPHAKASRGEKEQRNQEAEEKRSGGAEEPERSGK
jgi:hypothetical protein